VIGASSERVADRSATAAVSIFRKMGQGTGIRVDQQFELKLLDQPPNRLRGRCNAASRHSPATTSPGTNQAAHPDDAMIWKALVV